MILFLDFDGVLHPVDRPTGTLVLLPALERVLRDFAEVDIVISSAWREAYTLEQLRGLFAPDIQARVIDVTPIFAEIDRPAPREAEILAWLQSAGRTEEEWVAIDDIAWFFSPACPNLILTETTIGFDAEVAQTLRRRLSAVRADR
jgi:hypothetical protein